ncbi:MAG TPA: NAD(P)-dependent oxidoreductase [Vicinamibacterales bacterium]|jgi:UDP-glucose 4-epimerase|nr:NAD(P)-dependent oxidoreductase [Vicinamibacterales bacterium]
MTVLVTGARGFIGAALVRRLATLPGTQVVALARSRPDDPVDSKIHWVESNLEDLEPSRWRAAGWPTFDAVIHLAAFTPKSAAMRDHAPEIIAANVIGLQALLTSLPNPPGRFIFCSTLDVYARSAFDHVVDERSPVGPAGLYGLSKLLGEGLVEAYARSTRTECLILRLGHVYGPGEERYAKLVPETIRRVLANQPPRIAGEGSEARDLLYVDDAVEALVRACTRELNGTRIINIARGASHSILEIVNTIAAAAGFRGIPERVPRPGDTYSTLFDTSVMNRVLGDWRFVPLTEGLERQIAHCRHV